MRLLHALLLDASDGNDKSEEAHSSDNDEHKSEVRKISRDPEVVLGRNGR